MENNGRNLENFFKETSLGSIMRTNVITIKQDDDFSLAEERFIKNRINHLIVLDREDKLIGVLSQKYLYKTQSPRKIFGEELDYDPRLIIDGDSFYDKDTLNSYLLHNAMNKDPFILSPDDFLLTAILEMSNRNISCIPIVDEQRFVKGVIFLQDILNLIALLVTK
ncbi:MAG: CBS domain-containing protein [Candidatus Omnitrophica bacterium]|nr:CBS domain-containing protein [Candidatus Omnitrophota bacterium]